MVDRQARDEMVEWLELLISDGIDAKLDNTDYEKLDAWLTDNKKHNDDQTVRTVASWILERLNDNDIGPFWESKEEWDWLQRIKLLMRSDGELEWTKKKQWTWRQPVAFVGVITFIIALIFLGFTTSLFWVLVPLEFLLFGLIKFTKRDKQTQWNENLAPFSSVSEMLFIYRRTQNFAKAKYTYYCEPQDENVNGKNIFKILIKIFLYIVLAYIFTSIFTLVALLSPVLLLALSLPEDASRGRVVLPAVNAC